MRISVSGLHFCNTIVGSSGSPIAPRFLFLCSFDAAISLGHLSVACLCLAPTLMATELAADFRELGALGSHLWLFAGVETNVYLYSLLCCQKMYVSCLSLSLVWCGGFVSLLFSVAFAILSLSLWCGGVVSLLFSPMPIMSARFPHICGANTGIGNPLRITNWINLFLLLAWTR